MRKHQRQLAIQANAEPAAHVLCLQAMVSDWADIEAAADGEKKLRAFKMKAYTGGVLNIMAFWPYGGVVDLTGMKIPNKRAMAILRDHDNGRIVGHTTSVVINVPNLSVEGVISGTGADAEEVVATSRNGFPWQASIGAPIQKMEFIKEGVTTEVNGRVFKGPLYIARKTTLGEVSFTALGADDKTSAKVAAINSNLHRKETVMKFDDWLKAKALDPAKLSEGETAAQRLLFDAEVQANVAGTPPVTPAATPVTPATPVVPVEASADDDTLVSEMRAQAAAEQVRINAIQEACGRDHGVIAAKAIGENWSAEKTQLEVLRASRPQAPAMQAHSQAGMTTSLLECATVMSADENMAVKAYGAESCEAVAKADLTQIGLQQLLHIVACHHGYTGRTARNVKEVLAHAFGPRIQANAGFSTIDISGILSNVANKFMLAGFNAVEAGWRELATIRPVRDFKTITSYRLVAGEKYEKVGPSGELKHGKLDEVDYSNKADTYGRMYAITRTDIINDDLGALTAIPRKLGRAGALTLNDVFWTEWLDNGSFFTALLLNLITDALDSDGLSAGVVQFRKQVDPSGNPMGLMPKKLVVPPELEVDADELHVSTNINTGGAATATKVPNRNAHAGKYKPVVVSYLSNENFPGYSTTAWYLAGNPEDVSAIEVAFLNGQQNPTVESADADFNVLGIQMRGYHDFGVAKQEYRAAVKSTGAGE